MSSLNTGASLLPGFKLKLVNPGQIDLNSVSLSEVSQSDISQLSIVNAPAPTAPAPVAQVGQGVVDYVSSESEIDFDMDLTFSDSE